MSEQRLAGAPKRGRGRDLQKAGGAAGFLGIEEGKVRASSKTLALAEEMIATPSPNGVREEIASRVIAGERCPG
mgnify:CR=1 FL=1